PAKATAPNFAEWEAILDGVSGREVKLTAHAVDDFGNVEQRPHQLLVQMQAGATPTLLNFASEEKHANTGSIATGDPGQRKPGRPGSDAKVLEGTWQMVSQQRAGWATARPKNMKWVIEGDTIWLVRERSQDDGPKEKKPANRGEGRAAKSKP